MHTNIFKGLFFSSLMSKFMFDGRYTPGEEDRTFSGEFRVGSEDKNRMSSLKGMLIDGNKRPSVRDLIGVMQRYNGGVYLNLLEQGYCLNEVDKPALYLFYGQALPVFPFANEACFEGIKLGLPNGDGRLWDIGRLREYLQQVKILEGLKAERFFTHSLTVRRDWRGI
jgi:hypothetical protein